MTELKKHDRWQFLTELTEARVALGRAGSSLPTSAQLQFNLDHAKARDAIQKKLDVPLLRQQLAKLPSIPTNPLLVESQATTRQLFLQRPDLGRQLSKHSVDLLKQESRGKPEVIFVLADGLSTEAIHRHGVATLSALLQNLPAAQKTPDQIQVVVAQQARVALSDHIGALLAAKSVVLLIGERPGLSSADSLGIYYTFNPKPGNTDAQRNCISNIREQGLSYSQAAKQCAWLIKQSFKLGYSGVQLKDESEPTEVLNHYENFMLS